MQLEHSLWTAEQSSLIPLSNRCLIVAKRGRERASLILSLGGFLLFSSSSPPTLLSLTRASLDGVRDARCPILGSALIARRVILISAIIFREAPSIVSRLTRALLLSRVLTLGRIHYNGFN